MKTFLMISLLFLAAFAHSSPLLSSNTDTDEAVRRALYTAAHGDKWLVNYNWLSNQSHCTWFGVSCNSEGRVVGLSLTNNGLSGSLHSSIGQLSALSNLCAIYIPLLEHTI